MDFDVVDYRNCGTGLAVVNKSKVTGDFDEHPVCRQFNFNYL